VLAAVTPAALDVALEVFEELRTRKAEVDRLRRMQIERAREEAELAQRQFLLVRPEHRLVADALERQWNEALTRVAEAEDAFRRASDAETNTLDPEDRDLIRSLLSDLPRVWKDPRTAMRDRKRMVRLLIEDVTLIRTEQIEIHIRWKGGATTSIKCPLPLSAPDQRRTAATNIETVRALATEQTDKQIAVTMNRRGLRTGTGQSFTRLLVRHVRTTYGIPSLADHLRQAGWLTVPEVATLLGVHPVTAKKFAIQGVLNAKRGDDRNAIFFEPPTGPLPRAHPGKRFRDRRRFPQCVPDVRNGGQCDA
jgi:hypothetical protein